MTLYQNLLLELAALGNYIQGLSSGPIWAFAIFIAGVLGKVAGIPKFTANLYKAYRSLSAEKLAALLEAETSVTSFSAAEIHSATTKYVWPNCSAVDPSDQPDPRNVTVLAPALKTVSEILGETHGRAHMILLADSGMGKTTFCLNFYAEEMRKRPKRRRRVAIVPLGRPDAMNQIASIKDKRNTVLILDAFDEDPQAIEKPYDRLAALMSEAANCPWVLVTCRSQFFPSDNDIPTSSGVLHAGPRGAGKGREYPLRKLFLAPFSEKQVHAYIWSHFPLWRISSRGRRKLAMETIHSIGELAVRPMLLELVPDLVREHLTVRELFGLYEYMIQKWLERESGWVDGNVLLTVSKLLAVDLYLQQMSGGDDRMLAEDLHASAIARGSSIKQWVLNSRSLLNRDTHGYFKFAHRSILEYLFVVSAIEGEARCFDVPWTDLMKQLFLSWGYHRVDPASEERAREILESTLDATGILPFKHEIAGPVLSSDADVKRSLSPLRKGLRPIPQGWRSGTVSVQRGNGLVTVRDIGYGHTWLLIDTLLTDGLPDMHIYRDTLNSVANEVYRTLNLGLSSAVGDRVGNQGTGGRLPSLHEMWTLWECEQVVAQHNSGLRFLDNRELYWLGDALGVGRYMVCSVGMKPSVSPRLRLLAEHVGTRSKESFCVYEVIHTQAAGVGDDFSAMSVRIL
ncbi:hypothetical protein SCB29_33970 [Paraburkholderia sp. SIMBA_055]